MEPRPNLNTRTAAAIWALAAAQLFVANSLRAADGPGTGAAMASDPQATRRIRCSTPQQRQRRSKPLEEIRLDARPAEEGPLPIDCAASPFARSDADDHRPRTRGWGGSRLCWVPAELAHQPLYFDDVPLERYGQTVCPAFQPVISGARFFASFPVMPYKIGIDGTHDRIYTLGLSRPGGQAPCVRQQLPLRLDASLLEAGTWTGMVLLMP